MDVYERRRGNLRELLKVFSQAELSRQSGVHPTYISRNLKEPEDEAFKKIGETTARKYEAGARKLGIRRSEGWFDGNAASLDVRSPAIDNTPPDSFTSKGSLTALANTIASVPEILQPTARDALIKWASNQSTFEQLVAAIDALARANQPMPEEKPDVPSSPDDWRPIQQSEPAMRKRIRNPPGDQRRTQDGGS